MRRRTVKLIAAKELLDTLRDRRTLFVALVLPLLLYPALLLGMTQIIGATQRNLQKEKQRIWFDGAGAGADLLALLAEQNLKPLDARGGDAELRETMRAGIVDMDDAARAKLREAMADHEIVAAVICGEGFGDHVASFRPASASLVFDPTDEPSKTARRKITLAVEQFRKNRRDALAESNPDPGERARLRFMEQPVAFTQHEVATAGQKGAYSFAPMLGMLIVIMALTGAFYPAVDLVAGEKERGTMETLLVAPVTRTEVVLGKFTAIWIIAVVTALLNLFVMGITFSKLAGMIGSGKVAFSIPPAAIFAVTIILIPTSALFSALALALSSFATSYKEGQHYLSPLFLVAMPLSMVGMLPNIEIGYVLALVPVANVVLLVKAMLLGGDVLGPAIVAAAATAVYAGLGICAAVSIFKRESVLFRGGAGKSYDPASLAASRRGLPTEGIAVLAFFIVVALMFFLSSGIPTTAGEAARAFLLAQAAVLVPTLLLARRSSVNLRETLRLRSFPLLSAPAVILAAASGLILVVGCYGLLVPDPEPQGFERVVHQLATGSPWVFFLLLAVLPPICEELLCRGFILSAFRARRGAKGAVLVSAALFGALHLDLARFPVTFLAGLLLGYVLIRTGSIFASILFHMTWNGIIAVGVMGHDFVGELVPWKLGAAAVGLILSLAILARCTPSPEPADIH